MPKFNIGDEVEFSENWYTRNTMKQRGRWIGVVKDIKRAPIIDVMWTDTTEEYDRLINASYKEGVLSLRMPPKELKEYM
jgi:hypothetical protein